MNNSLSPLPLFTQMRMCWGVCIGGCKHNHIDVCNTFYACISNKNTAGQRKENGSRGKKKVDKQLTYKKP